MSTYGETMQKRVAQLQRVLDRTATEDVPLLHLADACQLVDERYVVEALWNESDKERPWFLGWQLLKGNGQGRYSPYLQRTFPTVRDAYLFLANRLLSGRPRGKQNTWPYFDVLTGEVDHRAPHALTGKASPLKGRPSPLKGRTGAPRPRTLLAFMGRIERKRR